MEFKNVIIILNWNVSLGSFLNFYEEGRNEILGEKLIIEIKIDFFVMLGIVYLEMLDFLNYYFMSLCWNWGDSIVKVDLVVIKLCLIIRN